LNAALSGPIVSPDLVVSSHEGATEFGAVKVSDPGAADPSRNLTSAPFDANTVETPVEPHRQNQTPRYPALLAAAGIEGVVVVRYVVDTLGLVESSSITVISSTHPQFERAVRNVLPHLRFDPAEFRGRKVRQLVEQAFGFELKR
jgi:TonB family protein